MEGVKIVEEIVDLIKLETETKGKVPLKTFVEQKLEKDRCDDDKHHRDRCDDDKHHRDRCDDDKHHRDRCDDDKHHRDRPGKEKRRCDETYKCTIDLEACSRGSFAQELIPLLGQPGQFTPAFSQIGNNITALLRLRFANDLRKLCFKLYVFDATRADNKIVGVHLHYGAANVNGPVLVTLFSNPLGQKSDGLLSKGIIRNIDISHYDGAGNPANQINSVASLYDAIRRGNIYFNAHSQLLPDGAARGQIYLS